MAWVVLRKEEVEQPTDKSEPSRPETVSPDFQQPVELKNIQQLQHWVHHEKQLTKKKCKNTLQKCIDFSHFHLWMWKSTIHPKSKKGNFSFKTWPVSHSESVHTCVKSVCCCQYPLNILKSMTSLPLLEYHFQLSSDLSWEMKAISTTIFLFLNITSFETEMCTKLVKSTKHHKRHDPTLLAPPNPETATPQTQTRIYFCLWFFFSKSENRKGE